MLPNATIFLPDVGAAYYYSKLKVYDGGGVCDKTIAMNLGKNRTKLLNYVLKDLKPTFIHIHGKWAQLYEFTKDDRFNRDYVPLQLKTEKPANDANYPIIDGDFLRKESIRSQNREMYDSLFIMPLD